MKKHAAGILVFRQSGKQPEVLLAHMGSPWWAKKDIGAWTIPKGEILEEEEPLEAAKREFNEEFSFPVPPGELIDLGSIDQRNKKTVSVWAVEGDLDATKIKSNTVAIEWPPKSGNMRDFPEIDRAAWFSLAEAGQKTVRGQDEIFKRLARYLGAHIAAPEKPPQPSLF